MMRVIDGWLRVTERGPALEVRWPGSGAGDGPTGILVDLDLPTPGKAEASEGPVTVFGSFVGEHFEISEVEKGRNAWSIVATDSAEPHLFAKLQLLEPTPVELAKLAPLVDSGLLFWWRIVQKGDSRQILACSHNARRIQQEIPGATIIGSP